MLVRIKVALHRRVPQLTDDAAAINGLKLDPTTHRMTATNVEAEDLIELDLRPMEFRLLHFSMTHPECMHSRLQLLDQVWGDHALVEECTADVHIKRLCTALALGGYSNMIGTVRGGDYRFARNPGQ